MARRAAPFRALARTAAAVALYYDGRCSLAAFYYAVYYFINADDDDYYFRLRFEAARSAEGLNDEIALLYF